MAYGCMVNRMNGIEFRASASFAIFIVVPFGLSDILVHRALLYHIVSRFQ